MEVIGWWCQELSAAPWSWPSQWVFGNDTMIDTQYQAKKRKGASCACWPQIDTDTINSRLLCVSWTIFTSKHFQRQKRLSTVVLVWFFNQWSTTDHQGPPVPTDPDVYGGFQAPVCPTPSSSPQIWTHFFIVRWEWRGSGLLHSTAARAPSFHALLWPRCFSRPSAFFSKVGRIRILLPF